MRALNSGPSLRKSGQSRDVGRTRHLELDVAGLSCLLELGGRGSQGEIDPVPWDEQKELPSKDVEAAYSPAASSFEYTTLRLSTPRFFSSLLITLAKGQTDVLYISAT